MNKKQKEVQQVFLDNEKECLKKIKENYEDALFEINDKIALLMGRNDADMQHVIYQIEYQKAIKGQIEGILKQLQSNEFQTVSEYLAKSYEDGFIGTMYDLAGQGIPLIIPIDQEQVVAAIQHETKLSEDLYTRLGKDTKKLSKQIAGEISRGFTNAATYNEITRNIANMSNIPKNNAARIARTEAHRIQCTATMHAQEKAREKGADVVKQWDSTLDKHTRKSHRDVDGEIRELNEKFSNGLKYPGDPGGGASEVINCRCALLQRAKWALDDEELETLKERAAYYEELDKAEKYEKYKKGYLKASKDAKGADSDSVRMSAQKTKSNQGFNDVTTKWFEDAKPGIGKITEADRYVSKNGDTYIIDGINVMQNNSPREIEVANILHDTFGGDIKFIPEVKGNYKNVKTPDYIWKESRYDLKGIEGKSKDILRNAISPKKEQAENFIIDISKTPLSLEEIERQVVVVYNSFNTSFVENLLLLKDKEIIKVYERT